jgi:hypothetical protein
VSRDPIEEEGGYNLYWMVANNAVGRWDYLGKSFWGRLGNALTGAASGAITGAVTGAIVGLVVDGQPVESAEQGQNGELSEKEKKKMLKKLRKEQRDIEKQLEKGEITEDEFAELLDHIRMGNGFGPIGGYVLEEAEGEITDDGDVDDRRVERAARRELIAEELAKERERACSIITISVLSHYFSSSSWQYSCSWNSSSQ